MQLALTKERRQTEALKHAKERADQLRNLNKGKTKREMVTGNWSFFHSVPVFKVEILPSCCDTFSFCVGFESLFFTCFGQLSG